MTNKKEKERWREKIEKIVIHANISNIHIKIYNWWAGKIIEINISANRNR